MSLPNFLLIQDFFKHAFNCSCIANQLEFLCFKVVATNKRYDIIFQTESIVDVVFKIIVWVIRLLFNSTDFLQFL